MTDAAVSEDDLLDAAATARTRAYAPYSGFTMGAAVATDTGAVVLGSLVENVSLGLAICAERAALFACVGQGAGRPKTLALVSRRTGDALTFPCGACLQVALELGGPDVAIVVADPKGVRGHATVAELLTRGPHLPDRAGIEPFDAT